MLVNAGPVMLLEVCEATLKDWLSENRTVTADMLEDILIFALDIARGVEFLHRQQVNSVFFFRTTPCVVRTYAGQALRLLPLDRKVVPYSICV